MRQRYAPITGIIQIMKLLGQVESIYQTILAGGSLTGNHWANLLAGSSCLQASLSQKFHQILQAVIGNSLNLQSKPGGHGDFP